MGEERLLTPAIREEFPKQKMIIIFWYLSLHPHGFRHMQIWFVEGHKTWMWVGCRMNARVGYFCSISSQNSCVKFPRCMNSFLSLEGERKSEIFSSKVLQADMVEREEVGGEYSGIQGSSSRG